MVLSAERKSVYLMKTFVFFCLLLPFFGMAQKLKFNAFDNSSQQWRAESFPVNLKSANDLKMDAAVRMIDSDFQLRLSGSGIGTNTIDVGSRLVLLLSNDDTVVGISQKVQAIEYGDLKPVYQHDYQFSIEDIEQLSRNEIKWIRKYSAGGFDDIKIETKNAAKLRAQAIAFLDEVTRTNALKRKPSITQPGFPGGKQVWVSFLNRNVKPVSDLKNGEKKTAIVQFQVTEDGSITDFLIRQSAGVAFDNELLRMLQRMPKWKPALQNGKKVATTVTQPVSFLNEDGTVKVEI